MRSSSPAAGFCGMSDQSTKCSVCQARERVAIDLALARGVSVGALAKRYQLGPDSLYRHRKSHMPPQLKAKLLAGPDIADLDLDRLRETESQSLLANLIAIRRRLFAALDAGEEFADVNAITRVVGQLHRNLEITGELIGDLRLGATTVNNVLVMPAYVELRVELVNALRAYPDAARAVAAVLHQVESKSAAAVRSEPRELAHDGLARAGGEGSAPPAPAHQRPPHGSQLDDIEDPQ